MTESVLRMLAKCQVCGCAFLPGLEGRKDGTACASCEDALPEEPRVRDGEDIV